MYLIWIHGKSQLKTIIFMIMPWLRAGKAFPFLRKDILQKYFRTNTRKQWIQIDYVFTHVSIA